MACLILVCAPMSTWAADTDGDGLDEVLETQGIALHPDFDLWDSANGDWIVGPITITGLSTTKPDLFVIWRAASTSNIDLATCDIFALGTKPTSQGGLGFNIWVLREKTGFVSVDRTFTDASGQKAVLFIESEGSALDVTGFSEYGTIMVEGKGKAVIYTGKILSNIESAANVDGDVQSSTGAVYCNAAPYSEDCLQCLHFQHTAIHEILHVLFTLDNSLKTVYSHHLTRGDYIMNPAIVYTEKKGTITFYISEVASSATQENWSFGSP
jgi:hypothetical protein